MPMEADIRKHDALRAEVRGALTTLRVQARQIWGDQRLTLDEIIVRLMVGVGDLARVARDGGEPPRMDLSPDAERARDELQKELGNVVLSTLRWIDDLGYDPMTCLDRAIDAQERYANSGRRR